MLTFQPSLPRSIASKTSRYAAAISRAASGSAISSPRTSMVASFPSPFSRSTTRSASSSSSPAMYRDEIRRTTGLGTAGSRRTIAESTRLTAREFLRACLLAALELAHQPAQEGVQLALLVVRQRRGEQGLVLGAGPQRLLPDLVARVRQLDQHAAPVVRVRDSRDEARLLEPV